MELDDMIVENKAARQTSQAHSERWEIWKPTEIPEVVQLIRGSYPIDGASWPVFPNWEAFIKNGGPRGKGTSCGCRCNGGQDKAAECVLHWALRRDLKQHEVNGQLPKDFQSTYRPRLQYAISMYRLSYFHKELVPAVGRDGTSYSRPDIKRCLEEEEIVSVDDTECPGCAAGVERFYGQRRYVQLGKRYFESLTDIGRRVGDKCKNCGSKIVTVKYVCPACADRNGTETVLLDPRKPPAGMEVADVTSFWKTAVMCHSCGRKVKPREVIKCKGGCEQPVRRTIFDVPVCLARQGEGTNSTLVHVGNIMDPIEYPKELLDKMIPYDFQSMFTVTTQQQAQILGFEDPFAKGAKADTEEEGPGDIPW
jgi:hypothetical protein